MFLLDHGLSTRVADLARASVGSRAYRVMRAEHTYWAGPTSDFFFSSIFLFFCLVRESNTEFFSSDDDDVEWWKIHGGFLRARDERMWV